MFYERKDAKLVAEAFATAAAEGDFDRAELWAAAGFHIAAGGFVHFDRPRRDRQGRALCPALRRDGELCHNYAAAGEVTCAAHRERRRVRVPGDEGER